MNKIKPFKLHSICSYFAMFPANIPNNYIKKYTKEGDIVLDTFSGRGTTILEARSLNRKAIGVDLNPLSFVLSKAKSIKTTKQKVLNKLSQMESKFKMNEWLIDDLLTKDMLVFYNEKTIKQLMFYRETYGKNIENLDNEEIFVLAILLGILHGPERKNGTSMYLSAHTSNLISMSPNYAKKWLKNNGKILKNQDVFKKIEERINSSIDDISWTLLNKKETEVYLDNALNIEKYFLNRKAKLIITSPPYLNIVNYTRSNWKRLWLLGFDKNKNIHDIKLDQNHKLDEYKNFLINYLNKMSKILDKKGNLILIIGNVRDVTFYKIYDEIKKNIPFKILSTQDDEISKIKSSKSFGNRKGLATNKDTSYIMKLK